MRFHLDENMPRAIAEGLRAVATTSRQPPKPVSSEPSGVISLVHVNAASFSSLFTGCERTSSFFLLNL